MAIKAPTTTQGFIERARESSVQTTHVPSRFKYATSITSRIGRPHGLTTERHNDIVRLFGEGKIYDIIAGYIGVSRSTLITWLNRGEAQTYIDPSERDLQEEPFLKLYEDCQIAIASHRARLTDKWQHIVTTPTTRRRREWKEVPVENTDEAGNTTTEYVRVLDKEVEDEIGEGDWQGIRGYLERIDRRNWGPRETLEVTGANGGPLQVEMLTLAIDRLPIDMQRELLRLLEEVATEISEESSGKNGSADNAISVKSRVMRTNTIPLSDFLGDLP